MQKGHFPYEYIEDLQKLEEHYLPPQAAFFNRLKDEGISYMAYVLCQKAWSSNRMTTMSDFQSARTRRNHPIRHQESGGKSYGTETEKYGPNTTTQWTSLSGATHKIAEELHQMHRAHQHDGKSRSHGANDSSPWTPVYTLTSVLTNTSPLPQRIPGQPLNRLCTQVGRSRVNILKWGFTNEQETCDCGIRQTMQHLLVCHMMDTSCCPQDLRMANGITIGCARHWEGTI